MAFGPNRDDDENTKSEIAKMALMLGIGALGAKHGGVRAVADGVSAGVGSHRASQDRRRKQSLEDILMERSQRREDELDRQRAATHDRLMRSGGYVGESENRPALEGRTLDDLMRAATQNPTFGGAKDVYDPNRYDAPIGGYKYDRLSPEERERKARATRAERDAVTPRRAERPIYQRVQGRDGQWYAVNRNDPDDVHLLEDPEGEPIKGRLPSSSTRPGGETPIQRDSRRAAEINSKALNENERQVGSLRRQMGGGGRYPTRADSTEGRVDRLRQMEQRSDSLRAERDRHASTFSSSVGTGRPSRAGSGNNSDQSAMNRDLAEARAARDRMLRAPGADSASVTARYNRIVAAIRQKYEGRK